MEDKLLDILDNLNISETSLLLEQDFDMHIDKNVKKRIMNSVKSRSQLQFENNKNILHKLKNIFSSLFVNRGFAMIMTIFILVTGTGRYISTTTPVAYVSLDINPSIELSINKFKKVISYEAYNSDGEILLDNNDKRNITVDKAISNIISSAISKKYLLDNNNSVITFATISNNLTIRKTLQTDLKNTVNNTLKSKSIEANIISSNTDFNKRLEAKNFGFTVSKYTLVEELKSLDSITVINDYKNISIINIENKILELRNNTSKDTNTNISDPKTKVDSVNEYSNKNINSEHTDRSTNNNSTTIKGNGNSNSSNNNSNSGSSNSSNNNSKGSNSNSSNGNSNSGNSNSSNGNSNGGKNNSANANSNSGKNNSANANNNSGKNDSTNNTDVDNNSHNRPNNHISPGHNNHQNINYGHSHHHNYNNYIEN
ncbi:hypothetical protein QOZ84_09410 [Romboutsia sedimentorum]|uniref:Anti-sigma factor RsgI-like middle domain-containing protein n=1 Tax=Romboutsia sedimentorum TaxID=1368474 RepID=A0ABT7ECU7_9FIRM|nr:hypothetical protein [Romboutsia sedimentorum]MDK2563766.1 hypothetical protein [Romboutsia sedimentorum]